ncbi:phage tail protein, partial [Sphingomonas montanisoli]
MGKVVKAVVGVAVAVGIAVAVPYLAPSLAFALGTTTAVASAVLTVGMGLAAGLAMKALGFTPKVGAPTAKNGTPTIYRQTIADSNIVYGRRRVGGLLAFFHARRVGDDYFRYFVIAVAGHRVHGVLRWFLGDDEVSVAENGLVTSGVYAGKAWLWFERGMSDAEAHDLFVAECDGKWTVHHRGRGIAKIYAKFSLTDDIVQAGMPNITCEIEGKDDIHDPRTDSSGYANNAALVFYDWMKLPREEGGFGAYSDEIPDDSWIAAQANVCDEEVELIEGGFEKRYTIDGLIVTGAAPDQVRDALVINCAGTFSNIGGEFFMRPGYWVPASAHLSEGDLAGPITVSAFTSGNEIANEVQGTYVEPAANYQAAPFKTQAQPLADPRQMDLDLAFVTSRSRATRIGRIMLRRALSEKTVAWPMNVAGLAVQAMDTVQLDTPRYGLANYAWTVSSWKMSQDFGVVLALREESPEVYDWVPSESPALPPHVPVARPAPIPTRYPDGTAIEDLQPAEPGATNGMTAAEAAALAALDADAAAAMTASAAALA